MKFRVFRMNISLTHLCIDFATGAFYSVRSAIHMRSNVSSDSKIDIAAAEIREGESERKRASESRTERLTKRVRRKER